MLYETIDTYQQGKVPWRTKGIAYGSLYSTADRENGSSFLAYPHFYQKQIVTRYLTNNPKLQAGIELKKLITMPCKNK